MTRTIPRSLLLATLVALAAFTVPAMAATDASITADPAAPGETATHTGTITVGDDATGSLNGFAVDYNSSGANASAVGQDDIVNVGIDRGDDAAGDTIDVNVSDDLSGVSVSNEGTYLTVTFGGSYSLNTSDEVVVVYDDVQNPGEEGEFDVTLDVNPQSSGGSATATLTTDAGLLDTGEETATPTAEETAEPDDTTTPTDATPTDESDTSDERTPSATDAPDQSNDDTPTDGNGPGFGIIAALLAFAGVALLARR